MSGWPAVTTAAEHCGLRAGRRGAAERCTRYHTSPVPDPAPGLAVVGGRCRRRRPVSRMRSSRRRAVGEQLRQLAVGGDRVVPRPAKRGLRRRRAAGAGIAGGECSAIAAVSWGAGELVALGAVDLVEVALARWGRCQRRLRRRRRPGRGRVRMSPHDRSSESPPKAHWRPVPSPRVACTRPAGSGWARTSSSSAARSPAQRRALRAGGAHGSYDPCGTGIGTAEAIPGSAAIPQGWPDETCNPIRNG